MINFNGEAVIHGLLQALAHRNSQQISEPAYKLVRLLLKLTENPVTVKLTAKEV